MTVPRMRLRSRVLMLTTAFALALLAITVGLSWRAKMAQDRWDHVVAAEMQANAVLDEIIRAHNAVRAQGSANYGIVLQLLDSPSLARTDTRALRRGMIRFERRRDEPASRAVVTEAQRLIAANARDIGEQLPALERQSREMMITGVAITWIVILLSFAAVQITLHQVVRPLEELARSAERIAEGERTNAPVAGDLEIAKVAEAFNYMIFKLQEHARTDDLTALPNFRAFRERIDAEIDRAGRYPEQFGVLVLDLDRFKQYNDRFGHLAGNDALQRVARALRIAIRNVDFAARYGGEEFAVILPQIDDQAVSHIAERIRACVEGIPAPAGGSTVTVSIGGAIYPADGTEVDALFRAADERLYQAKREGRNRVIAPAAVRRSADRQSA
ncbi:MAG TPA: diguanylate cyclase [Thermoanaerobaculia bacterium]|nr:diguanylate cyclase [Thermoanaerobaculia bacterium]